MHPPLEAHKHEGCDKVIEALEECHRAGTFNKFIGTCNAAKRAVDNCLKEEVGYHKLAAQRWVSWHGFSFW